MEENMRPFKIMGNEFFKILMNLVMELYGIDNISKFFVLLFGTGKAFQKFTDWYLSYCNTDYDFHELEIGIGFRIDAEVYNLMKLYHKNLDTRSIAFIFRNVVMFAFRYVIIEGISEWERFRDNVVSIREDFKEKSEKKSQEKFRRLINKSKTCTFSENIYTLSRIKKHRIVIYDENTEFIRQFIQ